MFDCLRSRTAARWTAAALILLGSAPALGQSEAETLSASFRKAAKRVLPAVVSVRPAGAQAPFPGAPMPGPAPFQPDGFGQAPTPRGGGGSGVVIDAAKGLVLTNDHVVNGAMRVTVVLHDGRERPVSQVRRDSKSDLALLFIEGKGLSQAEWGNSEALDTADWVLAIGHPFGLTDTVTAGIVSGKGRGIGMAMYEDLIQTDAAINPGNSGGPLINLKGEVVGINTAIRARDGGYDGVGFAIPASRAKRVAQDLAELGRVRRAYLGVQIGPADPAVLERVGQPGAVLITAVTPDSPASKAGLRQGDLVLRLQDKPIAGPGSLQAAVEVAKVGEPLRLAIDRNGERRTIEVSPLEQPESFGLPAEPGVRPFPGFRRGPIVPRPAPPRTLESEPSLDPDLDGKKPEAPKTPAPAAETNRPA